MSEKEKKIANNLGKALEMLPDGKREFLIGYAEGVAAMASRQQAPAPKAEAPTDETTRSA